ncbi:MAG: hypothetical protein P4L98_23625 [Ancalomicrobiaceae bacterium]|nr:hypothetical protein [Ancalomicrobiaceae bacterium]
MQLITKIDEANSHKQARSMIMAGWTARLGQWKRFDQKWEKGLRKAGLEYFHAKEMPNHPFTMKGVKIANDLLMFGLVIRLDRKDYEEVYRASQWGGKVHPDSMYGLCFRYLLAGVLEVGTHEYGANLTLNFTIETGHPNQGAPSEIINRLKKDRIKGTSEFLGSVMPADKKECFGLQAADGLATGAGWSETEEGSTVPLGDVSDVGTIAAVQGRFSVNAPIFRCHITRGDLARLRDDQFALADLRKKFGQQRAAEIADRKAAEAKSVES